VEREIVEPYVRLSLIYDAGWSGMSERYAPFLSGLLESSGHSPASVLDIACGTGTLAIALASRGHVVRGIDLSPEMVSIARRKAAGLPNVSFGIGDMRRLVLGGTFDLVLCTFDSVNYIRATDELLCVLRGVSRCLAREGKFVFDSNTHAHYALRSPFAAEREWDGVTVEHRLEYDPSVPEAVVTFRFTDGSVEVHRQRPYDLRVFRPLLSQAGFVVAHAFSDPERHAYDATSERLVCVAGRA
jgi:SAM-dependent methyltransferase